MAFWDASFQTIVIDALNDAVTLTPVPSRWARLWKRRKLQGGCWWVIYQTWHLLEDNYNVSSLKEWMACLMWKQFQNEGCHSNVMHWILDPRTFLDNNTTWMQSMLCHSPQSTRSDPAATANHTLHRTARTRNECPASRTRHIPAFRSRQTERGRMNRTGFLPDVFLTWAAMAETSVWWDHQKHHKV